MHNQLEGKKVRKFRELTEEEKSRNHVMSIKKC